MTVEKRNEYIELLRNNVCEVTFTKVNGEQRTMPCTLKEDLLPVRVVKEGVELKKQKEDVLSVFCTDKKEWRSWVSKNKDPYGKCCVDVARRVMEILDKDEPFDPRDIICQAENDIGAGGITGFMAGCVASMVSQCHSRGDEFRRAWNIHNQIGTEGERANEGDGVLNPALLNISTE